MLQVLIFLNRKGSKEIIQNIKEKKLRDQGLIQKMPSLENPVTEISPDIASTLAHNQKNIQSNSQNTSFDSLQISVSQSKDAFTSESEQKPIDQKIPYNEKVEQGIVHELSICAEKNIAIQDICVQIPKLPLEQDLMKLRLRL
ncbi:hypothetical protein Glove_174g186 [Diversispora epigaea]|uniref:Uncharacterized protein n=1 Tax=Diversispora epigaea TaxID=1348612 RepID=A0A397IXS0_9GLOM|nr:hypothetical protein Glove_174g186 [Diversispora epigaea]